MASGSETKLQIDTGRRAAGFALVQINRRGAPTRSSVNAATSGPGLAARR